MPTRPQPLHRAAAGMFVAALLLLVVAPVALGHAGGPEQVIVEGDHVDQGAEVHAFGAFIEADVDVAMRIVSGADTWPLPSIHTTPDGTFDTRFTLPDGIPNGYAQLVLTQPDQGDASTVFLVGPRTADTGSAPGAASSGSPLDGGRLPALLLFGATLVGIVVVGILLLRGGSRRQT